VKSAGLRKGGFLAHRSLSRSEDETEIRADEGVIKGIRRATRRHFLAEDKIRIVVEGLRGEESIAELCRREGIVQKGARRARRKAEEVRREVAAGRAVRR
jgi:transposase-like protein